jgi:hypothetical protein
VFVAVINSDASGFVYSGYLGGAAADFGYGIDMDSAGNAYIIGSTASADFPAVGAFSDSLQGNRDAFVAKILREPTLEAVPSADGVAIRWRGFSQEFVLEQSTMPGGSWTPVLQTSIFSNGWHTVTPGTTNGGCFFRLHRR